MGSHTLLRTMTRKSLMKFGDYADYTVDQLLQLKYYSYLRWVYYNCANVTFTIDVLELLYIDQMQIDKPGKDARTFRAVQDFQNQFIPFKVKKHFKKRDKQSFKFNLAVLSQMDYNLKCHQQAKNHGR